MKRLIYQLRMIMAEQFLWWAYRISPKKGEDSANLARYIVAYMNSAQKYSAPTPAQEVGDE